MMRNLKFIFLIIISFFLSFCAPVTKGQKTSYFNWDIELQNIRKIAILPFENYTRNERISFNYKRNGIGRGVVTKYF